MEIHDDNDHHAQALQVNTPAQWEHEHTIAHHTNYEPRTMKADLTNTTNRTNGEHTGPWRRTREQTERSQHQHTLKNTITSQEKRVRETEEP